MSKDLRDFLNFLRAEHPDELWEVRTPISIRYEMTALALELEIQKRFPAILFQKVEGPVGVYDMPVVSNLFASRRRIALMLKTDEHTLLTDWSRLSSQRLKPRLREDGPVKEVILSGTQVDLIRFPIPTHFEVDTGAYITAGIIIARDPDTGIPNLSYARLQVKGPDYLGASLHSRGNLWDFQRRAEQRGQALPIAIVIGVHPAVCVAAATRLPLGMDEMELAGGFLQEPVDVVQAQTADLLVPADGEIVIEGVIEPYTREDEGPFGEYTGYASSRSTRHVVRVTAITHRREPIFHDIVPGASSEHLNLSKTSRIPQFFDAVKKVLPNVVAMNYPQSGTHFHCYLSMRKTLDGQPRQAMALLFGLDMYLKLIIVVDEDIDVFNESQVLWALATRFQADHDLLMLPDAPCNLLDPSSENGLSAKLGLDATRKFGDDVKPLQFSTDIVERVRHCIQEKANS